MLTLLLALSVIPSQSRVVSRCRSTVAAPRWMKKATVRNGRLFSVRSSLSDSGDRHIHPTEGDIKKMEAQRKELAKHCFGPSCNIAEYAHVPLLNVDTKVHHVHPVDDMVREMERKRRELAAHCFGPSCNVEHYEKLGLGIMENEVNEEQETYRISPLYANREEMERKRKELQEHCFGPSCSSEHYEQMKIPEMRIHPVDDTVRAMEKSRKELAKHCFGPSCNSKMYENIPRALSFLDDRKQ